MKKQNTILKAVAAQEVLTYAANKSAGLAYSGNAGTEQIGSIIPMF